MLALSKQCIGFHGVTLICKDKAIILSAPSGTGKTTLANLLQKYHDAATVNGDFALLSCDAEHGVVFEPTPFCGTSNVCHNFRLPISRIVFLEQAKVPSLKRLTVHESLRHLLSNVFVPVWSGEMRQSIEEIATEIIKRIPMDMFSFPPTETASDMLFSNIIL